MNTPLPISPKRFRPGELSTPNRFPVPAPTGAAVTFSSSNENKLELLKNVLLRETLNATVEPGLLVPFQRAANEAASLAWMEPFPLLVFPELFSEKVAVASGQVRQQSRVRARTARLTAVLA